MPEGEFLMGKDDGEQHLVRVPRFLMGRYPVTQAQWRVVAGYEEGLDPDPSHFKGDNRPVERVSWEDAQEFCARLSRRTGKGYGLPSEAQWEYGCRAGSRTGFCYGDRLEPELANYGNPFEGKTSDVGSFPANEWGLCDVHGNVSEWCEDDWHSDYKGAPDDGSAWVENDRKASNRLLRGGSWNFNPENCRSSVRFNLARDYRNFALGFRVSCVLPRILLDPSSP
jgi:formylglycine-generating enzyme required for sulfatase activity